MSKKILIVDDEPSVEPLFRQRFRREVRSGEIELLFAFSGEAAIQVLNDESQSEVALVLSDINMPGMTGLELLCRIKNSPPPLPVCMMTAYGSDAYREKAQQCNCDGYLTKPIDFIELKQKIREYSELA